MKTYVPNPSEPTDDGADKTTKQRTMSDAAAILSAWPTAKGGQPARLDDTQFGALASRSSLNEKRFNAAMDYLTQTARVLATERNVAGSHSGRAGHAPGQF